MGYGGGENPSSNFNRKSRPAGVGAPVSKQGVNEFNEGQEGRMDAFSKIEEEGKRERGELVEDTETETFWNWKKFLRMKSKRDAQG